MVHDQCRAALRRGVPHHAWRAAGPHERAGLLYLQASLHEPVWVRRCRLRCRPRLRVVRRDLDPHAGAVLAGQSGGALLIMSGVVPDVRAKDTILATTDASQLNGETGMVER